MVFVATGLVVVATGSPHGEDVCCCKGGAGFNTWTKFGGFSYCCYLLIHKIM